MGSGKCAVVLLVEDKPIHARDVEDAFAQLGFKNRIVVRDTTEGALRYLLHEEDEANDHTWEAADLVLLDQYFDASETQGLEMLRQMRTVPGLKDLPVIMLTASYEADLRAKSYKMGANGFLQKPFQTEQFLLALETLPEFHLEILSPDQDGGYRASVILLIDNDETYLDLAISTLLQLKCGNPVQRFRRGDDVIGYLADKKNAADLIFLDWQMPEVGGEQVLREVRTMPHRDQTTIIVVTTLPENTRLAAIGAGASGFFTKPISPADVLRAAQHLPGYRIELRKEALAEAMEGADG